MPSIIQKPQPYTDRTPLARDLWRVWALDGGLGDQFHTPCDNCGVIEPLHWWTWEEQSPCVTALELCRPCIETARLWDAQRRHNGVLLEAYATAPVCIANHWTALSPTPPVGDCPICYRHGSQPWVHCIEMVGDVRLMWCERCQEPYIANPAPRVPVWIARALTAVDLESELEACYKATTALTHEP